jgi:hypothetical protein
MWQIVSAGFDDTFGTWDHCPSLDEVENAMLGFGLGARFQFDKIHPRDVPAGYERGYTLTAPNFGLAARILKK